MGKKLHFDKAAEKEATDIGAKFMHSSDVVGDMSRAYGRDLSSVRIHTDESAARGAAERGVDAFSTGKDVFFGRGAFDRNDPASRGLLAHELSHSMQQGVGGEGGAMAQSAPMGAAQGGLIDWFRGKFGKKKKPVTRSEPAPRHASNPTPVPISYKENFGEDGFDSTPGLSGYVLPTDLYNGQAQVTRFNQKEARDLYVALRYNPQLMQHPGVRNAIMKYYKSEMAHTFEMYSNGTQNRNNFSQEVLRGQNSGGMRLLSSLLGYYADKDLTESTAKGYKYVEKKTEEIMNMPDGPEKYAMMQKAKEGPDITQQMNQLTDEMEGNEELMNVLMTHSDTLAGSGFFESQEAADSQALNDFGIRGVGPKMSDPSLNMQYSEDERIRREQLGRNIQVQMGRGMRGAGNEGTKRLFGILQRWRNKKA